MLHAWPKGAVDVWPLGLQSLLRGWANGAAGFLTLGFAFLGRWGERAGELRVDPGSGALTWARICSRVWIGRIVRTCLACLGSRNLCLSSSGSGWRDRVFAVGWVWRAVSVHENCAAPAAPLVSSGDGCETACTV